MKRRLFSAALASIVALCSFGAVGAKERELVMKASPDGKPYVEITGDRASLVAFAIEWQESLWPGWQSATGEKVPTVAGHVAYVDECLAKGEPCCFYSKGKPWEQAVSVAFLKASK